MNFDKSFNLPSMVALMTAITSDPNPPEVWTNLMSNMLVRCFLIYVLTYEATSNHDLSLKTTAFTIGFFYFISTKDEKKKYVEDMFNLDKINIFKNLS